MRLIVLLTVVITITLLCTEMAEARGKKKKPSKKPAKGKPSKGKGKGKGKGKPSGGGGNDIFSPFTKPGGATCQCWWDLTRMDCACCKPGGMQCGFPMHDKCWKKTDIGCPGITQNKWTLSEEGHPCHWDHSDKSCAWCKQGAFQCGKGKDGQQCYYGGKKTQQYCESVIADCGHIGKDICDPNAECEFIAKGKGKLLRDTSYYGCKCQAGWDGQVEFAPKGWTGGIQCIDADGNFSQDPTKVVSLAMTMTNEFFSYERNSTEFPDGPSYDNLFDDMATFIDGGANCFGCEGTLETIP